MPLLCTVKESQFSSFPMYKWPICLLKIHDGCLNTRIWSPPHPPWWGRPQFSPPPVFFSPYAITFHKWWSYTRTPHFRAPYPHVRYWMHRPTLLAGCFRMCALSKGCSYLVSSFFPPPFPPFLRSPLPHTRGWPPSLPLNKVCVCLPQSCPSSFVLSRRIRARTK